MTEKRHVIDEVRFTYNGSFEITEFYRLINTWCQKNDMDIELKRKVEHVEQNGKNVEYTVELWQKPEDWAKPVVRLRAMFHDVKEVILKKPTLNKKLQHGKVLLIFDGFLETDLAGRWQQKPTFWFARMVYDKYIWKFWTGKYEDTVTKKLYNLFDTLKAFFQNYGY